MVERMWRAIAAFRLVTLAYAARLNVGHHDRYAHPLGEMAQVRGATVHPVTSLPPTPNVPHIQGSLVDLLPQ
ncbi:MAG: hypothetical protein ACJ768_01050 [Gaiellaceae bacterium]